MIQNAQDVGDNTTPEKYNTETAERGNPEFVVRAHVLAEILRNAQRWVKGYESPESKAKKFGELLDCLLLTPMQWPKRYTVLPLDAPRRPSQRQIDAKKPSPETVAAIQWWAQFTREHPGETIADELNASVHAAIARLTADKANSELLRCSRRQVMIVAEWKDEATGLVVPMKCLIDLAPDGEHPVFGNALFDLKTTKHASPRQFARDAQAYRYDVQAALYLDLWNAAHGEQRSDFGHVVIENFHPYEFRTPPPLMTQRFIQFGRVSYQKALWIYCQGLQTGIWPSYDQAGKSWPLTDCEDWFLSMEHLYEEMQEEEEPEEEEQTAPDPDLIP